MTIPDTPILPTGSYLAGPRSAHGIELAPLTRDVIVTMRLNGQ